MIDSYTRGYLAYLDAIAGLVCEGPYGPIVFGYFFIVVALVC